MTRLIFLFLYLSVAGFPQSGRAQYFEAESQLDEFLNPEGNPPQIIPLKIKRPHFGFRGPVKECTEFNPAWTEEEKAYNGNGTFTSFNPQGLLWYYRSRGGPYITNYACYYNNGVMTSGNDDIRLSAEGFPLQYISPTSKRMYRYKGLQYTGQEGNFRRKVIVMDYDTGEWETGTWKTSHQYDAAGRLRESILVSEDANGKTTSKTRYAYNAAGKLDSVTSKSEFTRAGGQPDNEAVKDRNKSVKYSYRTEAGKQLITCHVKYPALPDQNSRIEYTYSAEGWLLSKQQVYANGSSRKMTYSYDKYGNWTEEVTEYFDKSGVRTSREVMQRTIIYY